MLPSRGFFKKNDCPFFEKGLCQRPHCHFRHRKKVVNENSSSTDSQELPLSENANNIPNNNSISAEAHSDNSVDNISSNSTEKSSSESDKSSHDSLFAKLVNQSNPYEKINRHIPCAYTPTPQIKGVQAKNRATGASSLVYNTKTIEILKKTQSYNDDCSSISNKLMCSEYIPSQNKESENINSSVFSSSNIQSNNKYSVDASNNKFSLKNCKNETTQSSNLFSFSYEPQSIFKTGTNNTNPTDGVISKYVPSKVTIPETEYMPNTDDSQLPNDYVPSKEKSEQTQYVPEPTGNVETHLTYQPSGKSSTCETKYDPEASKCIADYVPTEKSKGNLWLRNDKIELNNFDFISSEIEMMKNLLKEDSNVYAVEGENISSIESTVRSIEPKVVNENEKNYAKENSVTSKSNHRSRHKSKSSSHSHSSSKSKHSKSSSNSKSSRSSSSSRHHSSSSKHHSSSNNEKSSEGHRHGAERDKKNGSDSHKSSSHHGGSHKSHKKSKSRDKDAREKSHLEKQKSVEIELSNDEDAMNDFVDNEFNATDEEDSENDASGKKRKNSGDDESRCNKMQKKSEVSEVLDVFDDDPDTVEKECLEIFNSYSTSSDSNSSKKNNELNIAAENYENFTQGKKRTAHCTTVMSDHSVLRHKTVKKSHLMKSAHEVMLERYKTLEKAKESSNNLTVSNNPIPGLTRPSIRIAAVSNIQQMLQAKKAIQEKINQGRKINERTTIAQTVAQGSSRVAHTPSSKEVVEKPTVKVGSNQVPRFKRQIYVDKLLLETNQIFPTKSESAEEALKLEEEVFRAHSGSFPAYHTAFMSVLMKTKRRLAAVVGGVSSGSSKPKISHQDVLSGGKKNFSIIKTKKMDITMLSERHIYEELLRCKLTPEELKENSFPIEGSKPGYATCALNFELKYNDKYLHIKKMSGNRRYCIRCCKQYEVDPVTLRQYKEGPETCSYHPGKKKSGGRNCERIYNCCNSSSTEGCATHVRHVTDCNDYENLPNCVKTLAKDDKSNPGVFALDCEMVYTRLGYELARVTVVNLKKEVVYDTLVKPKHPIECYNTFFSGIEENMMVGVETTLKDVQAVLLSMFSDKTILIGHSLDSDLRALHLIHDTVVDTAIVYKNEKYHPYKYSLKDLCAKKISKIIQENVGGHDSAEDATAALEIMLNHVKEEVSKYDSLESYEADRAM